MLFFSPDGIKILQVQAIPIRTFTVVINVKIQDEITSMLHDYKNEEMS